MTLMKILTFPDHFLKNQTKPVENIDGALQDLIENMALTMYEAPGIGLAAIQVGIDKSLIIYDVAPKQDARRLEVLINPEIIDAEGDILSENEGCLSVPEFRADVRRYARVQVEGVDRHGNPLRFEAEGLPAIMLQHEIDHLSGTLFIDHISKLKRELYTRRVNKQIKNREETT